MKKVMFVVIFLSFFSSCKKTQPDENFYNILNENFVHFIEYNTLNSGRFVLEPDLNRTERIPGKSFNNILVDTVISDSKALANSILPNLKKENLEAFEYLLRNSSENKISSLEIKKIMIRGQYNLYPSGNIENIDTSFIGQVIFPRPYISADRAIIFFTVSISAKAGRTMAFFLSKKEKNWHILKILEVERW